MQEEALPRCTASTATDQHITSWDSTGVKCAAMRAMRSIPAAGPAVLTINQHADFCHQRCACPLKLPLTDDPFSLQRRRHKCCLFSNRWLFASPHLVLLDLADLTPILLQIPAGCALPVASCTPRRCETRTAHAWRRRGHACDLSVASSGPMQHAGRPEAVPASLNTPQGQVTAYNGGLDPNRLAADSNVTKSSRVCLPIPATSRDEASLV